MHFITAKSVNTVVGKVSPTSGRTPLPETGRLGRICETPICRRQPEGGVRRIPAQGHRRREPHDAPGFPPEPRDGRRRAGRALRDSAQGIP